jgi:hypothetical protein
MLPVIFFFPNISFVVLLFQFYKFILGKFGPGTYTYEAGHNLILAHARAYRLYQTSFKAAQQGV